MAARSEDGKSVVGARECRRELVATLRESETRAQSEQHNTNWKNDLPLPKTVTASFQVNWMRRDLQTMIPSIFG